MGVSTMFEIREASIKDMQRAMETGEITSRSLILQYYKRIAEYDSCEGGLNSILQINPDALFIADLLDSERKRGIVRSPVHGIPILIKANINTGDKMTTSAGSLALKNNFAPKDAHIVKLLRSSGAVIMGKTNLTEFANYMTGGMRNGYSSLGGSVLSPYDIEADPSGSSAGSAVAVSANLCAAAIGTETSGSIISPAQKNGIAGIKPTMGLLSRTGIIPISNTLDTAGPMTRTVEDAAIILGILQGLDKTDAATCAYAEREDDYTKYLDSNGLNGMKIGIIRAAKTKSKDKTDEDIFDNFIKLLKNHGVFIIDNLKINAHTYSGEIMQNEFKCNMNAYLSNLNSDYPIKTLDDIIKYNQDNAKLTLKFEQTNLLHCQNYTSGNLTESKYLEALINREELISEINDMFDTNNFDILVNCSQQDISAYTGFPCMTVPMGFIEKMPYGFHFIGRRYDEGMLLKAVYALENIIKARCEPKLLKQ